MDKEINISIPEELFNKLEEEAIKNHLSLDELILRKLNKIYSDSNGGYLTNKVKNSRIDYLEKERERLLKQMYESRLFDSDQTSLYYIEKELEDFIPKTEEEKKIDEIVDKILAEKYGEQNINKDIEIPKEDFEEILTDDEKKELIKTMEKSNDKLSGRKYGKGAYSIIRKILDKHKEEGIVFQKKILLEIRWLRWNS